MKHTSVVTTYSLGEDLITDNSPPKVKSLIESLEDKDMELFRSLKLNVTIKAPYIILHRLWWLMRGMIGTPTIFPGTTTILHMDPKTQYGTSAVVRRYLISDAIETSNKAYKRMEEHEIPETVRQSVLTMSTHVKISTKVSMTDLIEGIRAELGKLPKEECKEAWQLITQLFEEFKKKFPNTVYAVDSYFSQGL